MMITTTRTVLAAAALTGLSLIAVASATSASAAPPTAAAPTAAGDASIRAAHFSPTTPGVDIYLTAFSGGATELWHGDETYGTVSPYLAVPAGQYVVSMRLAGAPASSPAMLSWTLQTKAGDAYTAAAIGTGAHVTGVVLDDDLAPPAAGHASVRLIQAASNAPKADVVAVSGPTLASDAVFGTSTGYAQVMAGTWPLEARSVDADPVTASGSVSVPAGSVTSIVLLNGPGKTLMLRTVLDAAAPAAAPVGPIDAGGGGMAPNAPATGGVTPWPLVGAGSAAGLLGFALFRRRRRAQA